MVSNLLIVLKLHHALVQSEVQSTSRHHNSKLCGCSMCSHHELGKGCDIPGFEGIPATKVCHPLKHKCLGAREVEYIIHDEDGLKIVTMLLLLSGDVETNPGPGITIDKDRSKPTLSLRWWLPFEYELVKSLCNFFFGAQDSRVPRILTALQCTKRFAELGFYVVESHHKLVFQISGLPLVRKLSKFYQKV